MGRKTAIFALFYLIYSFIFPQYTWGSLGIDEDNEDFIPVQENALASVHGSALLPIYSVKTSQSPTSKRWAIITAYSSTPDQTDSSPFTTASGTRVRDGVVASNWLPLGAKIRLPRLYEDKIFVVEDRMAPKNSHKIDIWFPEKEQALQFGIKWTEVEIIR